jgi:peptidoglycan/xylan/chitin deacetylase (PgdA/CDA1 family)
MARRLMESTRMRPVPILTYHMIAARPAPSYVRFTVTPDAFARQMAWLAAKGYTAITPGDLLACRQGGRVMPRKPVVLTFDDGCVECVDHATAILSRHGFTAIFYLVTGFMGATSTWTLPRRRVAFPLIDWSTARHLVASGFTCGSHTVSHSRLAELSAAQCREELTRSRAILQDRLGVDVVHLSYPFGSFNPVVRQLTSEAGYETACSVQDGLSTAADDPWALHRLNIGGDDTFTDFRFRVLTGKRASELLPKPVYSLACRARSLFSGLPGQGRSAIR